MENCSSKSVLDRRRRRLRQAMRNMKEASWRAACDRWVSKSLLDRKGASTPIYQLYNSYIENNPDSYMDIGQFGKVLRSWFPHRKRRRGKQGAQIYVYQDVALKPRINPKPRHKKVLPQYPPSTPLRTCSKVGHAKSFSLLNPSQHGPLSSVPSMMVGNQKVGPILVSIPEGACTASSTTDGLKDRSESMVSSLTFEPKRKYEDESSNELLITHKKKKISYEDDSALLMKDEIKDEIEFEEESCLQLDHLLLEKPPSQPLPSNEKQKESGTVPTPPLEPVTRKRRKPRRSKHPPQTSCKEMMALARQWVDANLIDRKGATTAASVFFEAYVHDNPDKHLPQNSLAVVIRGKFPTRRKPIKQDSKVEYYYQDLELVKRGDISALYPSYLGTATSGSSGVVQVSTDQSGGKKNSKTGALSTIKNITAQERRSNTKKSKGMEDTVENENKTQAKVNHRKRRSKVTPEKRGRLSFITRSKNRLPALDTGNEENRVTDEGNKEENLTATEGKEERRQATETERAKVNPVIFTDTDRGIPVAVANPPSESVFNYQGVPCVMIPINHKSNIIPHAQDPTVLANVKGRAVVSPLAKMISVSQQVLTYSNETRKDSDMIPSNSQTVNSVTVSQQVLTYSNETRKDSDIIPSSSQTVNSVTSAPLATPVKNIDLKGKIHIKTVASINARDFSSFGYNEMSETSTCLVHKEHSTASSSLAKKEKQNSLNFEEKEEFTGQRSYINKNSSDIQGPVDENDDISCQSLNDRAPVISPSLRPLPDMDVLDYIKSEMAEDDEYVSANVRMKSSQNISKGFDTPGSAAITHNNDVFMCESQLMDLDRNITDEMISEHMTGVTSCDSEMAKQSNIVENSVHAYDDNIEENSENTENRPVCVITEVKSQSIQGNDNGTLSEHKAVSFPKNVENKVTENENNNERESANNRAEMFKTSTQLEGGVEKTRRDKSISKVDRKVASSKKMVKRWDEDIRSFVTESDTVSRFEDSKIPKKRRKKKKEGNPHQTVTECSSSLVNSPRRNSRHTELPKNTHTEKYELLENSETRVPLSDKTFDENDEQVKEHKQTGEKVKRAVLSVTFELLSQGASLLTETEKAQKLEGALFDENPAVHYDTKRVRTYSNINKDCKEYFPCIPSSTLEDLKLCSYEQSTQLLQHHQACPQLGCQKCCILRAAYVHITLLRHRCQVWHTFTKIVSRHSRACMTVECSVLFCQYVKHELHLSGVSVLSNHHLDENARLKAEFKKCLKAGPHEATLHCSHLQDVSLPVPWMTKRGGQQQQTHSLEARGLKVMSDLLMPDRPRDYDITTPILHTLHIAAAHHEHHTRSKE
ncbi:uncharacterized protein [Panulirus ornatus]|uniref:uncharacterized protein isoform X2 n=1 Tax=Panulirus ornatus TaxID=150431 RepID=UPI003A8ABF32